MYYRWGRFKRFERWHCRSELNVFYKILRKSTVRGIGLSPRKFIARYGRQPSTINSGSGTNIIQLSIAQIFLVRRTGSEMFSQLMVVAIDILRTIYYYWVTITPWIALIYASQATKQDYEYRKLLYLFRRFSLKSLDLNCILYEFFLANIHINISSSL